MSVHIHFHARDKRLGDWGIALDPATMMLLLQRHLLDTSPNQQIEACRPCYVKYTPSRYCFVQYELALRNIVTGTSWRTTAYATILRDERAKAELASPAMDELATQASIHMHQHLSKYTCYLPELRAALQVFPVDLRLPGLVQAASATAMNSHMQLIVAEGRRSSTFVDAVDLVRYKPARRAVLRYRLAGASTSGADGSTHIYGKLRADERGATLLVASRALAAAGVATPPSLAYLPDLRMVVQAEAKGIRLKDLRGSVGYNRWLLPVADALAELHAARITNLDLVESGADLQELAGAALVVGALLPELAAPVKQLAERLIAALHEVHGNPARLRVIVHGSFHDDQVLVVPDRKRVALVDLDSVGIGNPLEDVGHFLAYLTADGATEQVRNLFLDAYCDACRFRHLRMPESARRQVLIFEATTLLRWCTLPFRELDPDWPTLVEQRVALASQRLAEYEQESTASFSVVNTAKDTKALASLRSAGS